MKMIKSIEMEILGKNKVKKERYVDVTLYKFSQDESKRVLIGLVCSYVRLNNFFVVLNCNRW